MYTWNDWRHKYAFQYLKLNFPRYSMIIPPIVLFGVKCLSSNPKKKWLNCPSLSRTVWHDHCIINSLVVSSAFRILEGFLRVQMKLLSGFFLRQLILWQISQSGYCTVYNWYFSLINVSHADEAFFMRSFFFKHLPPNIFVYFIDFYSIH